MARPSIPNLGPTRSLFDPPLLVFQRWERPIGGDPTSLDLLLEFDSEIWHLRGGAQHVGGPYLCVEEALDAHPELLRVGDSDTRVHWPDVGRVEAADALEPVVDTTVVLINGEWWHGERCGDGVVLATEIPGSDETYVARLSWSQDPEGRADDKDRSVRQPLAERGVDALEEVRGHLARIFDVQERPGVHHVGVDVVAGDEERRSLDGHAIVPGWTISPATAAAAATHAFAR